MNSTSTIVDNNNYDESPNYGIAFAMVIAASCATGIGASVVFIPKLVKLANRHVLASSLGFSAGVMTFVSFAEILPKGQVRFEVAGFSKNHSFNLAILCFFGGVMLTVILSVVTHKLSCHMQQRQDVRESDTTVKQREQDPEQPLQPNDLDHHATYKAENEMDEHSDWGMMCLPGCSDDLNFYDYVASKIETDGKIDEKTQQSVDRLETQGDSEDNSSCKELDEEMLTEKYESRKLLQMGMMTAMAIGLHNFPEGLATFVAVLEDPAVGTVLTVAIAIHNIPEGLCVALPVYYATGSRRKAFLWGTLSGMTEIIAAFVGWLVLSNSYSNSLFGVLFGMVAGMMVTISFRELLPTAHRHDVHDKIVSRSFIVGMAVMALSLVLFRL